MISAEEAPKAFRFPFRIRKSVRIVIEPFNRVPIRSDTAKIRVRQVNNPIEEGLPIGHVGHLDGHDAGDLGRGSGQGLDKWPFGLVTRGGPCSTYGTRTPVC